jgi:hypothetical protein
MADGTSKPIEEIEAGDLVLSVSDRDPESRPVAKRVVQVYHNSPQPIVELRAGDLLIRTTANHPIYVDGRAWTAAAELQRGDRLRTMEGSWLPVESIRLNGHIEPVFNCQVEDHHTYFVGAAGKPGLLVHNYSPSGSPFSNWLSSSAASAADLAVWATNAAGNGLAYAALRARGFTNEYLTTSPEVAPERWGGLASSVLGAVGGAINWLGSLSSGPSPAPVSSAGYLSTVFDTGSIGLYQGTLREDFANGLGIPLDALDWGPAPPPPPLPAGVSSYADLQQRVYEWGVARAHNQARLDLLGQGILPSLALNLPLNEPKLDWSSPHTQSAYEDVQRAIWRAEEETQRQVQWSVDREKRWSALAQGAPLFATAMTAGHGEGGIVWAQKVMDAQFVTPEGQAHPFATPEEVALARAMTDSLVDPWTRFFSPHASFTPGMGGTPASEQLVTGILSGAVFLRAAALAASATSQGVQAYEVGTADALQARSHVGDNISIHHVGQAHAMEQLVPGYSRPTGPAIALPTMEHLQIPSLRGTVSLSPRQVLARDIWNLRNYTNAPNSNLQQSIQLNKQMYPGAFGK